MIQQEGGEGSGGCVLPAQAAGDHEDEGEQGQGTARDVELEPRAVMAVPMLMVRARGSAPCRGQ